LEKQGQGTLFVLFFPFGFLVQPRSRSCFFSSPPRPSPPPLIRSEASRNVLNVLSWRGIKQIAFSLANKPGCPFAPFIAAFCFFSSRSIRRPFVFSPKKKEAEGCYLNQNVRPFPFQADLRLLITTLPFPPSGTRTYEVRVNKRLLTAADALAPPSRFVLFRLFLLPPAREEGDHYRIRSL